MITLADYWMGRDITHAAELTEGIRANAGDLVERVNWLLSQAAADGVYPALDATTRTIVASGWRPRGINAATSNAGASSKHLTGNGGDLRDQADRSFARWCLRNESALVEIGLWMEDPRWTPSWVHLQRLPPGSGKRIYVPSTAPALVAKLPEQRALA